MNELIDTPAPELARQIADGDIRARDLAEAVIENYSATGESGNAYRQWEPERVRAEADAIDRLGTTMSARQSLHGMPVAVKDLYGVEGYRTCAGTPDALPSKWEGEGAVVSTVKAQSGLVTGKTHTVEFAFGGLGVNHHYTTPRNPWGRKIHRVPGGSSSGAGVSLGCGTAKFALGTDTGGSVRIPASVTGNVGLKTTSGRWSIDGIVPLSPTLDTPGPLARTVTDVAWAFGAIDGAWGHAPSLLSRIANADLRQVRIAIARNTVWDDLDPGIGEAVESCLADIAAKGARRHDITMPEIDDATALHRLGGVVSAELDEFISAEIPESRKTLWDGIAARVSDGGDISAREYLKRRRALTTMAEQANRHFESADVIAMPTVASTPPSMDSVAKLEDYRAANFASLRNTNVGNCLGLCAITLPAGLDAADMPVGLMLMARAFDEEHLLAIALAIEAALGTPDERLGSPPVTKA